MKSLSIFSYHLDNFIISTTKYNTMDVFQEKLYVSVCQKKWSAPLICQKY